MATPIEILGALGVSYQIVQLSVKAIKLYRDMSTGFKDANGEAALIHQELFNFKQSAKFAHHNLKQIRVDDLGLKQSLLKYEGSISQLGRKMQAIHSKKKLWGQTKRWMALMSSDSEVTMLRRKLKRHTKQLAANFSLAMLKEIKRDVRETRRDVRKTRKDVQKTRRDVKETGWDVMETRRDVRETRGELFSTGRDVMKTMGDVKKTRKELSSTARDVKETGRDVKDTRRDVRETMGDVKKTKADLKDIITVGQSHYEHSRNMQLHNENVHQELRLSQHNLALSHQASTESLHKRFDLVEESIARLNLQTPVMSPFRLDDDDLFALDTLHSGPSLRWT